MGSLKVSDHFAYDNAVKRVRVVVLRMIKTLSLGVSSLAKFR